MFGGPIGSTRSRLVPPGLQHAGSMFDPRDQTVHPLTSELFTKTVWWLGRQTPYSPFLAVSAELCWAAHIGDCRSVGEGRASAGNSSAAIHSIPSSRSTS